MKNALPGAGLLLATLAVICTTTAPTVIHAGIKDNVLPSEAYALVNFRLLPGDTMEGVSSHLRQVIADDGVELREDGGFGNEASVPSPIDNNAFRLLERTAREIFPEAVVSTGLGPADDPRHQRTDRRGKLPADGPVLRPASAQPGGVGLTHGLVLAFTSGRV